MSVANIVKITLNIVLNPIFLPIYLGVAPTSYKMDFKVEPDINSVEVIHNWVINDHPVDAVVVITCSLWPILSPTSNSCSHLS